MIVDQTMCLPQQQRRHSEQDVLLPGFRFHPTDEELVGYYLRRKVMLMPLQVEVITLLDIYKFDPWDLPRMAVGNGEKEWYFFCPRDRKYRNSARPNRVTGAGFWKATGTDRPIYSGNAANCIGLKKSLVFYKGRAARGLKTDWMMHEFRLPPSTEPYSKTLSEDVYPQQDAWAVCRIFKKSTLAQRHGSASQPWEILQHEKLITESVGRGSQMHPECLSPPDLELDASSPESSSDDLELDQVESTCGSVPQQSLYSQQTNPCYGQELKQVYQLPASARSQSIQKVNSFGDLLDAAARSNNVHCRRSNISDSVDSAAGTADPFFIQESLSVKGALDFVNCMLNSPQSGPSLTHNDGQDLENICPSVGPKMTTPAIETFRKKLTVQIPQGPLVAQPSCGSLQPWDMLSPIFPLECM